MPTQDAAELLFDLCDLEFVLSPLDAARQEKLESLDSWRETFKPGQWYSLLIEMKGDEVVATVEGKKPLRATSKDFHVKKPGLEFRVIGPNEQEVHFDNLRVWELK